MIRRAANFVLAIAATVLILPAGANDSVPELHRNPFDRPEADVLVSNAAPSNRVSTTAGEPMVRAILAAGPKSVVNLDGVMLQIGESAHGFRLVSVSEGEATFSREGKTISISLYEPEQVEEQ